METIDDIKAALAKYGIDDFLILGLQERPGDPDRRGFWGLSTRDLPKFVEGLSKLFIERDGIAKLLKMILEANDIERRLTEVEALIQKEGGKA